MPRGGAHKGAGRKRLDEEDKKSFIKVYITQEQKEHINEYGKGNTLSSKALELLSYSIHQRKPHDLTFIDLFAGIGGFRLALESLGHSCVFSSEINKAAISVYEKNFNTTPSGDIRMIQTKSIPDFDILCAGLPCQSFSPAGRKQGFEDDRGALFFEIVRILREKQPRAFILENVSFIKQHNNGEIYRIIMETLQDIGYKLYDDILNSVDFGVPQERKHRYCIGLLDGGYFAFPKPYPQSTTLREIIDSQANVAELQLSKKDTEYINNHFSSDSAIIEHFQFSKPGSSRSNHRIFSTKKENGIVSFYMNNIRQNALQERQYYSLDSVAKTLTTSNDDKLWDLRRKLSALELSRLQGYPDTFTLPTSHSTARRLLANSITVPVVKEIAIQLTKSLR